jgi:hypothetical protein
MTSLPFPEIAFVIFSTTLFLVVHVNAVLSFCISRRTESIVESFVEPVKEEMIALDRPLEDVSTSDSDVDSEQSAPSTTALELKEFKFGRNYTGCKIIGPRHRDMNIPWCDSLDALKALHVPSTSNNGWIPAEHSQKTIRRIFPVMNSKYDVDISKYKMLFAFQCNKENGVHAIKGALQHRTTGCVVMLTSHNSSAGVNKPKPAHEEGWTVFGVDMIAPPCFWNAFKAC